MTASLPAATWSPSRLSGALEALARESRLPVESPPDHSSPPLRPDVDDEAFERWIQAAAGPMQFEAEPVEVRLADIDAFLARTGPALLLFDAEGERRILAIVEGGPRSLSVVGPDLRLQRISLGAVSEALRGPHETPAIAGIDELLERAGVPLRRRGLARARLVQEQVGAARITGFWRLRPVANRRLGSKLREARVPRVLAFFLAVQTLHDVLWMLSWWIVGRGALEGHLDWGWLTAWALLLVSLAPLQALATWSQALLTVGAAGLFKQRLLEGALRTEPDEVRHHGIGWALGRVLESEAIESLAQSEAFLAVVAVVELGIAALALGFGAGGPVHLALLVGWLGLGSAIAWRYARERRAWTEARLAMTHDLVERMVGHRTRLAQQDPARWHDGEDHALEEYLQRSRAMDRMDRLLEGLLPRGWVVLGLAWLGYRFFSTTASAAALALTLAGILLAQRALARLVASAPHLVGAIIAWRRVAPLFHAASRREVSGRASPAGQPDRLSPVLEARKVAFRYEHRFEPILSGCDLRIDPGDRVLLRGRSGSGKSTLASLLSGLRVPQAGLVLYRGLDRQTVGATAWRRGVAVAPQFQENYVFGGTLAFNLLMGRRWPPRPEDLEEAEAVCRELGLGALLERMAGRLQQLVGETGWQLSHGERSRVYIARALLQNADLVVLDESLAELDPETMRRCLQCVVKRTTSLLLIAHR